MIDYQLSSRSLQVHDIQNKEIESILIKTYKVRELVLRKLSTPLQLFFNEQKQPVQSSNSDRSQRTESAALLGNANVDGGGKQESCKMPKSAAMQENSQSNSAELLVFPGCEPPARPSSADPEPERNVREQLAGGQQDLRIELNALGNAAHVAVQMPPLSGPSVAHIHKQLCSVLAAVICCVVRLTAFVLSLGYFVGRQSVHSSNAVGVTCQCANASATLEVPV